MTHSDTVTMQPPTVSLGASPSLIAQGDSSTLTWNVSGAASCTGSDGSGGWSGSKTSSDGSHTESVSPLFTTLYTITCSNPAGSDSDNVTVHLPSGGISATSCTVLAGDNTCDSTVSWSSSNFLGTPAISQDGTVSTVFSNAASNPGIVRAVNPDTVSFTLEDTGGSFSDITYINISCAAGSTWVGGVCITDPVINVSPNYDKLIRSGSEADIEITVLANYPTNCSMDDGVNTTFSHVASPTATTYNFTTRTLTSAQIVTFECHHATYPSVSSSDSVRVEVVPTVQEI